MPIQTSYLSMMSGFVRYHHHSWHSRELILAISTSTAHSHWSTNLVKRRQTRLASEPVSTMGTTQKRATHNLCSFPFQPLKFAIDNVRLLLTQNPQCNRKPRRSVPWHLRVVHICQRIDGLLYPGRPLDLESPKDPHRGDGERALGNVVTWA